MSDEILPVYDDYQDVTFVSGNYDNGVMTFTFTRKRDTGHYQDVAFTDDDCAYFIFSYGGMVDDSGMVFEQKHYTNMKMSNTKFCFRRCPVPSKCLFFGNISTLYSAASFHLNVENK